jgi:putative NADH-flavin reductase
VRNPAKLDFSGEGLMVFQGNVLNEKDVDRTLEGCQAVINVIGHVKGSPPDLQTVASRNIVSAMKQHGIKRLIDLTGGGVNVEGDNPGWFDRTFAYAMMNLAGKALHYRMTDGEDHVRLIRESDLEWTIVRAPVLLPGKAKGKTSIGMVGHVPGYSLRFEDLTDEIIRMLEENSFIRQSPYLTNG